MINNDIKQFPEKLLGSFWGLTSFFNPENHKNKLENYYIFREANKKQGLKLITVECAFENRPFQLTAQDADILIQVRSNSVLWQKERLLNIALSNLPKDCDKIVWLDCDIIFLNQDWVFETVKMLENYVIVKPFKRAVRISKKDSQKIVKTNFIDLNKITKSHNDYCFDSCDDNNFIRYASVFAWAGRRSAFSELGFYDKMIVGGGDFVMTTAFIGHEPIITNISAELKNDIDVWSKEVFINTKNSLAFVDGEIIHLFHGTTKNRKYTARFNILKINNFNPGNDLRLNEYQCFEWNNNKQDLHLQVKSYFKFRNENDLFFRSFKNFFLLIKQADDRRLFFDELVGKIGLIIKRINPSLYYFLKKKLKIN